MIEGTVKAVSRTGKGVNIDDQWYNTGKPIFKASLKGSVIKFSVNDKGFVEDLEKAKHVIDMLIDFEKMK